MKYTINKSELKAWVNQNIDNYDQISKTGRTSWQRISATHCKHLLMDMAKQFGV